MANRFSRYIPLGYEPVQPPLDVLAEVIKTKRQQNDAYETYLDTLGAYKAKALPGTFMEPIAAEWNKGLHNDILSLQEKALTNYNGDYTQLRSDINALKRRVQRDLTTGEIAAIEATTNDYYAKSKEYAPDFKKNPLRLSQQQQFYLQSLRDHQEYDPSTGRYPNVGSLTPPPQAYDVTEAAIKLRGEVPVIKGGSSSIRKDPRTGVWYTTDDKTEAVDPANIQATIGQGLKADQAYIDDLMFQAKVAEATGNLGGYESPQHWAEAKFQRDASILNSTGVGNGYYKDKKGNLQWDPAHSRSTDIKFDPFDLKRTKDAGVEPEALEIIRPNRVIAPFLGGLAGTPKEMGIVSDYDILGAFGSKYRSNETVTSMEGGTVVGGSGGNVFQQLAKNIFNRPEDRKLIENTMREKLKDSPVGFNKPLFDKMVEIGIKNNSTTGAVINMYNNAQKKNFINQGGEAPIQPEVISIGNTDQQIETTNQILGIKSTGVTIIDEKGVVKSAKDGYNVGKFLSDYGKVITGKSDGEGPTSKSPALTRATLFTGPTSVTDGNAYIMELGDGKTALINANDVQYQPENNSTVRAKQQLIRGRMLGKSEPFSMVAAPYTPLGQEINSSLGSQVINSEKPLLFEVASNEKDGSRKMELVYNIYDPSQPGVANKGKYLGTAKLPSLPTQLNDEEDNTFMYTTSPRVTKHYKGNLNETYTNKAVTPQ